MKLAAGVTGLAAAFTIALYAVTLYAVHLFEEVDA